MTFKLVRDKNEEWCRANGVSGQWRTAPDPVAALRRKAGEEYLEYIEGSDPAELYDLLDVVQMLVALEDPRCLYLSAHRAKVGEMGGFGQLVEWSPVPAGFADWTPDG